MAVYSSWNHRFPPIPLIIPPIIPPGIVPPVLVTPPVELPRGAVAIDTIVFLLGDRDPSPVFAWPIDHRILEIPINGFADITIGLTGDGAPGHEDSGSLWKLKVHARSLTEDRFRQFWDLMKRKGPYFIQCPEMMQDAGNVPEAR